MTTTAILGGILLAVILHAPIWAAASVILGVVIYLWAWRNASLIPISDEAAVRANRHGWAFLLVVIAVAIATLAWQAVAAID